MLDILRASCRVSPWCLRTPECWPTPAPPEYEAGFANGLARNGWTVTLIGSDMSLPGRLDEGVRLLNLRGSQDPGRPRWRKALNLVGYWLRCYGYVALHRTTPVHIIGKFTMPDLRLALVEARLTRLLARRYVLTVHELLPHDDRSPRAFRLSRAIYRTAAVCVTHTRQMADALATDFGLDRDGIVLVEHGIDRVLPSPPLRDGARASGSAPMRRTRCSSSSATSPHTRASTCCSTRSTRWLRGCPPVS